MEKYWIFEKHVAKCRQCDKKYTKYMNTYNLTRHMIRHDPHFKNNSLYQYFELQNNMMKCKVCDQLYKICIRYKLVRHSKQHESMIDTGKLYKKRYWWIKYCILEYDKAQCKFCDSFYYITIDKIKLKYHITINHSEIYDINQKDIDKKNNWIWQYFVFENNNALCTLCKQYFSVKLQFGNIRKHLNEKHEDKIKEKQDDESGEDIHDNAKIIMKSRLEHLANDVIQIHNIKKYLED